ncbi:MAG TPA: ubiquitin-like protein Pup [Acidimicrobiaceae bacterium]|nr:ubiquitin-like protein Pup [Acidimicrobiaceae bacterium]HAX04724.1 ubiquitin-like protein Pup [Acidimicrobiaceae bacterium]|tara:strand:+ start:1383 stop:1577 length:195 start_codon:yes stop_codon:yes gene_type:complete
MAEQEQRRRSAPRTDDVELEETGTGQQAGEELKAELDDLLDEIDDVLETNAEEFVKNYVQKGGE